MLKRIDYGDPYRALAGVRHQDVFGGRHAELCAQPTHEKQISWRLACGVYKRVNRLRDG